MASALTPPCTLSAEMPPQGVGAGALRAVSLSAALGQATRNGRLSPASFPVAQDHTAGNMPSMPNLQIMLYQQMNTLSSRMVQAARARDWQTLDSLARSVDGLRTALAATDPLLSSSELQQKSQLIQRILDDDAEIRRHTEPWMESVCHFLGQESLRTFTRARR